MEHALRPLHGDFIDRYLRSKEARVVDLRERTYARCSMSHRTQPMNTGRVRGLTKQGRKLLLLMSLTAMQQAGALTFVAVFQVPESNCVKVSADQTGKITVVSPNVKPIFGYHPG
jgi:hypothetical protein